MSRHPLVELFRRQDVNSFAGLASVVSELTGEELTERFAEQVRMAPRRGLYKKYFCGHNGETTSGAATNRREEHLAIALWLAYRDVGFVLPDGTRLFPVDYQFPLKSHRDYSNAGIGKVDVFCADDGGQPWIIELKVHPASGGRRIETPLKALLEALAYCAIVDADVRYISRESYDKREALGRVVGISRPNLMGLAPAEYWALCHQYEARHSWQHRLTEFHRRLERTFGIQVRFVELRDCCWHPPGVARTPCFVGLPTFQWAMTNG